MQGNGTSRPAGQQNPAVSAERALIASLLQDPAAIAQVQLSDAEFVDPSMGVVFKTMREIFGDGYLPTVPAIKARLGDNDYGFGDLRVLEQYTVGSIRPDPSDLARIVREASQRRALTLITKDFTENISNAAMDPKKLVDETTAAMLESSNMLHGDADALGSFADMRRDMDDFLNGDRGIICPTGIPPLDEAIGGWQRSNYLVLGARPGMGKSTVAVDLALRAAKNGVGVLICSLEMSPRITWLRMLSALTKLNRCEPSVDYKSLLHSKETPAQKNSAQRCNYDLTNSLPISVIHPRAKTVESIHAEALKVRRAMNAENYDLGLIIVDHMGKMTSSSGNKNQNKTNEVGEISNGLANLSRALDLQVIAASQLNRASVQGENKRPDLTSLRNSGDIEQDADSVLFVHREQYYLEQAGEPSEERERLEWKAQMAIWKDKMEILISKSRNGEVGIVKVGVDMAHSIITGAAGGAA